MIVAGDYSVTSIMDAEKKQQQQTVEHREDVQQRTRSDSDAETAAEELGQGNVPDVDTSYASTIKVSKLKGRWLMWMVSGRSSCSYRIPCLILGVWLRSDSR